MLHRLEIEYRAFHCLWMMFMGIELPMGFNPYRIGTKP